MPDPSWVSLISMQSMIYNGIIFAIIGAFSTGFGILMWGCINLIRKRFFTIILVKGISSPAYPWIKLYLQENVGKRSDINHVCACFRDLETNRSGNYGAAAAMTQDFTIVNSEKPVQVTYLPEPNVSYRFVFQNKWIWISNDVSQNMGTATENNFRIRSNKKLIEDFFQNARQRYILEMKEKTIIWSVNPTANANSWQQLASRPSRSIDTIILPGEIRAMLIRDMREFLESEKWYYTRGIPYRRGYLLYGPPGCGKTSFITAAAGELQLTICIVNLSNEGLSDDNLLLLLSKAPRYSMILIEDVDACFRNDTETNEKEPTPEHSSSDTSRTRVAARTSTVNSRRVTFSGLLNAMDGCVGQEGKMLFMTTNHIEKLDQALIRPGRIDMKVRFGLSTKQSAKDLFLRFFKSEEKGTVGLEKYAEEIARKFPENKFSLAELQGFFMKYKNDHSGACKNIDEFLSTITKNATQLNETDSKKNV